MGTIDLTMAATASTSSRSMTDEHQLVQCSLCAPRWAVDRVDADARQDITSERKTWSNGIPPA